ncbi:MAG: hypothetical protein U0Q12_20985 [Vicinamibacterales bacterium]
MSPLSKSPAQRAVGDDALPGGGSGNLRALSELPLRFRVSSSLATLACFAGLAVVHTWPLVTAPATWCRNDNADAALNEWALAWVAHALRTGPLDLFNANIFHPERLTLAYSEHLIVQGAMGAPLTWAGASPVLVYNIVWLLGLTLSGWAGCSVIRRWTGSGWAGLVGGTAMTFTSLTFTSTAHIQAMHTEFLPLALYAFDRVLEHRRVRDALTLGAMAALQMLCSGYLLVFTAFALVAASVARLPEWTTAPGARRRACLLALAGVLTVVICLPFLVPYARVRAEQGLVRSVAETAKFSARPTDYLATVSRLHFDAWSHRFYPAIDTLFPGAMVLGLAAVGARRWREPRVRSLAAIAAVGFVLSFGPTTPVYVWLYRWFPLLQGVRGASRFGFLVLFGLAGLAAFGLARLESRLVGQGRPAAAAALGAFAFVAVNAEAFTAPLDFVAFPGVPNVYAILAKQPDAVVAEFPFPPIERVHDNGAFVVNSTAHWRPLVNGYSGFASPAYARRAEVLSGFPDDESWQLLRELHVSHIVMHVDRDPALARRLQDLTELTLVAANRDIRIYAIAR